MPGVDVSNEERDGIWALMAVEVYELLVGLSGWTAEQYEAWLTGAIERLIQPRGNLMTSTASTAAPLAATDQPARTGVNHLALFTKDVDATVRFYDQVIGAPLVATIADERMRHYFFRFCEHCTVAFFQYVGDDEPRFEKVAGVFDSRAVHFDHLTLNLPGEEDVLALQKRLREAGQQATEVIDHVAVRSIYFTDPNGFALGASRRVLDPTTVPLDHDGPLFSDPDPVPAVRELAGRPS